MGIAIRIGGLAVGSSSVSSWQSYGTTLIPMPLFAYGTSESTIDLSVTDVFSGGAKLAWYGSNDNITYSLLGITAKGVLTYQETGLSVGTLRYYKVRAEQGVNHSEWSNVASTHSWVSEYTTLDAALTGTKPSSQIANAQNNLIAYYKGGNSDSRNVWNKIDAILGYAMGMPTASDSLFWINNPTRKATLSATPPTYVVGQGWTGIPASNTYIDTTFNPSTGGVNYVRNSASSLLYIANNRTANQDYGHGGGSAASYNYLVPNLGGRLYSGINSLYGDQALTDTNYLYCLNRTGAANYEVFLNKTSLGVLTKASVAVANNEIFDLCVDFSGAKSEYSGDTVGLRIFAAGLDATAIKVFNDGWANFLADITPAIIFSDTCDGITIDLAKWTVVNNDPTKIIFTQDNALQLNSLDTGGVIPYFDNMIYSKTTTIHGVFSFSSVATKTGVDSVYSIWGLFVDANNRIEFYTDSVSGDIAFRIIKAGSTIYSVDPIGTDLINAKIVVDQFHNISVYQWINDDWVQIGVTQNAVMGEKAIFMACRGYNENLISIRDIYITGKDRDECYPINKTDIATDIRSFGGVPDGITDNAAIINNALVLGNVLLQDGVFAIGSSILNPSNRTLYELNAKIVSPDDSFDNIWRNSDPIGGNINISLIGLGNAVIDGNAVGNDSVNYAIFGGLNLNATNLYKANQIFLGNVDNFEVSGIISIDRPAYFGVLQKATNGIIKDIYFNHKTIIQNQDGIQICYGTHDVNISNLRGITGDDFVSIYLGTKAPSLWYRYGSNHQFGDVYNIDFGDIYIHQTKYHGLIFILGDGNKIHDINFDDVVIGSCSFFCYFGNDGFVTVPPAKTDFYNINMDNILVKSQNDAEAVIKFIDNCKDVTIINFDNDTGKSDYVLTSGDQSDNVTINGVQVT